MDKIKKLFKKIKKEERRFLKESIIKLISGETKNFNIEKIKNTNFLRLKRGRFRIIFHYEKSKIIIDSIKIRNEKTYK
ncbi:MAG: hypothetical protein MCSN_2800 [Candidatus Microsyncoccus archaeolyticus]|nr:MAG: hypothetical protein MCSN_2800 [Candidatus Parcubacteria bacterium]